ncbi:hypothetical protein FHX37_1341 [Haloactinospora alba]|uniref:Uncharacterized protein n=1 Tax=Haloactinospora alba TaxID=405555 RepID=A0A543NHW6_9ACTN|nr:hypothetical protein [Haloactinospora alba]TQN31437.1 hypothetical protein FHX37_1341 [Haloactinospora alba]
MDSSVAWMALFGLPIAAILVIVGFAWYHMTEVEQDDRDDVPDSE